MREGQPAGGRTPSNPPCVHLGFESAGLTIRPVLRGDLLPSKQVTRVRFPSRAPAPTRRCNARVARAAPGRPPAFQAGRQGSLRLLACELGSQLPELEFLAHQKDPGLLIRESWVRIPPGPPEAARGLSEAWQPLKRLPSRQTVRWRCSRPALSVSSPLGDVGLCTMI